MSIFDKRRNFSGEGGKGEVLLGEQALKFYIRDIVSVFHAFIDPLSLQSIGTIKSLPSRKQLPFLLAVVLSPTLLT